jgi:hypothetical protein
MKHCHGPCNQGREACSTPEACELRDGDDQQLEAVGLFALVVAAVVVLVVVGLLIA